MSDSPEQHDHVAAEPSIPARPSLWARWSPALFAVGLIGLYYVSTRPTALPEGWRSDYEATLTEASATHHNLLLAFHSPGCPPCEAMEREVLSSPAVTASLRNYLPVRVDATSKRELANRFGVFGTPTYAIVDGRGRLVSRCSGFQPIKDFVAFLDRSGRDEFGRDEFGRDESDTTPSATVRRPSGP